MELLNKTGSAGFLFGFTALFRVLVAHFNPVLAFALTLFVTVLSFALTLFIILSMVLAYNLN